MIYIYFFSRPCLFTFVHKQMVFLKIKNISTHSYTSLNVNTYFLKNINTIALQILLENAFH